MLFLTDAFAVDPTLDALLFLLIGVAEPLPPAAEPFFRPPETALGFRPRFEDFAGVEGREAGELWREERGVGVPRSAEASPAFWAAERTLRVERAARGVSSASTSESFGGALFFLRHRKASMNRQAS